MCVAIKYRSGQEQFLNANFVWNQEWVVRIAIKYRATTKNFPENRLHGFVVPENVV